MYWPRFVEQRARPVTTRHSLSQPSRSDLPAHSVLFGTSRDSFGPRLTATYRELNQTFDTRHTHHVFVHIPKLARSRNAYIS